MNTAEANAIVEAELAKYRGWSFEQLCALIDTEPHSAIPGPSGVMYQVEVNAFWDSEPGGPVRVLVAADDGGWSAFSPLTRGFIKAPDGSFVGE